MPEPRTKAIHGKAVETPTVAALKAKQNVRDVGRFVKGPLPLDWLVACDKAHPVGLLLALGIRHLADVSRRSDVPVGAKLERLLEISPDQRRRALAALEAAGLVEVSRYPGQTPRAMLVGGTAASGRTASRTVFQEEAR